MTQVDNLGFYYGVGESTRELNGKALLSRVGKPVLNPHSRRLSSVDEFEDPMALLGVLFRFGYTDLFQGTPDLRKSRSTFASSPTRLPSR